MALILFVLAFAAFCVSAVAGGGAGLVLLPVLRTLLPVKQTPVALSIGTVTGSAARLHAFRKHVRWDVGRVFAPVALPFAALGAWLLSSFQPAYVDLLIALFLLSNLPAALGKRKPERSPKPATAWQLRVVAMLAGFISGFTGSVGLLFNGFYRRLGISKDELIATRAANEIGLQLLRVILYSAFGLMRLETIFAGGLVAITAVLAAYASGSFVKRIREDVFRCASPLSLRWETAYPRTEVPLGSLPASATSKLPSASIVSVEEFYSLRRHRYEVVYRHGDAELREMEIVS